MAITYTVTGTSISPTEIFLTTDVNPELPSPPTEIGNIITNTLTGEDYDFSDVVYPCLTVLCSSIPKEYTFECPAAWSEFPNWNDGVYRIDMSQGDALWPDNYESETYVLVTTEIDAGILALPTTTLRQQYTKLYAESLRQIIQDLFDAADYTECNEVIKRCSRVVLSLATFNNIPFALVYTAPGQMVFDLPDTLSVPLDPYAGGYCNYLQNTLDGELLDFTSWEFDIESGVPQNFDVQANTIYPTNNYADGVYLGYLSVVSFLPAGSSYNARMSFSETYELVTTNVDNGVTQYSQTYNPNDPAQVAIYNQMLQLQQQIQDAYTAEDYELVNDLIQQLQSLLSASAEYQLLAEIISPSIINAYYENLSEGGYSGQLGVITNTLTGQANSFGSFPQDEINLNVNLESGLLGFGVTFPDGVYQISNTFIVDGETYQSSAYVMVTTNADCCISKLVSKRPECRGLQEKVANLSSVMLSAKIAFAKGDYLTANANLKYINKRCSDCKCGCGG
jgi:hypothetical protein